MFYNLLFLFHIFMICCECIGPVFLTNLYREPSVEHTADSQLHSQAVQTETQVMNTPLLL